MESRAQRAIKQATAMPSLMSGECVPRGIMHSAKNTGEAMCENMGPVKLQRVMVHDQVCLQVSVRRIPNQGKRGAGLDKLNPTLGLLTKTWLLTDHRMNGRVSSVTR